MLTSDVAKGSDRLMLCEDSSLVVNYFVLLGRDKLSLFSALNVCFYYCSFLSELKTNKAEIVS